MNNLLKKFGAFSIGSIVAAFIGFITVPIITYFISPEEYGKASMFTLAQGIASVLVYLGIDQAYAREFNSYKNNVNKLLSNAIVIPFCFAVLMCVTIIANSEFISYILFDSRKEIVAVYMLALMLPFMVIENFSYLEIRMKEKGLAYSFATIFLKLLILLLTVAFFILYEKSFHSVVYAMALAEIINGLILFLLVLNPKKISVRYLDKILIKRMLKFGLPFIPAGTMGWFLGSMDKIMLRTLCGFEELGLYAAAYKIVAALGIIQSCFTLFWIPVAYRWNEEKVPQNYFSYVNFFVAIGMSIMCLLLLILKNIVGLILGNDFIEAINIFPFLLLYPVMYTMSETTMVGIAFSRKTYYNIVVSGVSCIVNVILNFILIPFWGSTGAAVATGLSFIVFFVIRTGISRKVWWKFPIKKFLPIIVILLINCFAHTFILSWIPYFISIVSILIVIIINKSLIKEIIIKLEIMTYFKNKKK